VNGDFAEAVAAETTAEGAEALAITDSSSIAGNESGDWAYSATAEGRTGEVAVDGIDVDAEPGLIYTGPAGGAVRVAVKNLDVSEGTIAPEAGDSVVAAVLLNNTVVAYADEGFTAELDTETAVEFNMDTYVGGLQSGDVIRVALIGGAEETADWDVAEGGTIDIV
jgi:hypothetical protein